MDMKYEVLKYNRIKDIHNDCGLSQSHVAGELGVAQNTMSQYETGERNIPNEAIIKIAIIYKTSINYLLGLTDEKRPYTKK